MFGLAINSFLLYLNYLKNKAEDNSFNSLVVNMAIANLGMIFFALPLSSIASFKELYFLFFFTNYLNIYFLILQSELINLQTKI